MIIVQWELYYRPGIFLMYCTVGLPFEEIEHNSETVMVVTSYGGHFGFIEGLYPNKKTWMDRAVLQILATFKTR